MARTVRASPYATHIVESRVSVKLVRVVANVIGQRVANGERVWKSEREFERFAEVLRVDSFVCVGMPVQVMPWDAEIGDDEIDALVEETLGEMYV
jgi:hypothetical protein